MSTLILVCKKPTKTNYVWNRYYCMKTIKLYHTDDVIFHQMVSWRTHRILTHSLSLSINIMGDGKVKLNFCLETYGVLPLLVPFLCYIHTWWDALALSQTTINFPTIILFLYLLYVYINIICRSSKSKKHQIEFSLPPTTARRWSLDRNSLTNSQKRVKFMIELLNCWPRW